MGLPKPVFSFTIPSLHDGTILECRLYHPREFSQSPARPALRAAIVAHPYAPLGGCYDDPVVVTIGELLLKAGYIVGTFNFRGAGISGGRTSWSANPELADYVSFYGFMVSYLNHVRSAQLTPALPYEENVLSPIQSSVPDQDALPIEEDRPIRLILAGYSYGSMIASRLPPIGVILEMLRSAQSGHAEAEICLRASNLAQLHAKSLEDRQQRKRQSRGRESLGASDAVHVQPSQAVSVGGYECEPTSGRLSRDSSRRSLNIGIRKSFEHVRSKLGAQQSSSNENVLVDPEDSFGTHTVVPEICYLLISPLLPPIAFFTTMFSSPTFTPKSSSSSKSVRQDKQTSELVAHPSYAIYGDKDTFTSQTRLRKWAEQLKQKPKSLFRFQEIDGAGHFWQEKSVADRLKISVQEWIGSLDAQ